MTDKEKLDEALNHLGGILYFLSDLHTDHRCLALDNAEAFYNAERPHERIERSEMPMKKFAYEAGKW